MKKNHSSLQPTSINKNLNKTEGRLIDAKKLDSQKTNINTEIAIAKYQENENKFCCYECVHYINGYCQQNKLSFIIKDLIKCPVGKWSREE